MAMTHDRPRERILTYGTSTLSDGELVALILGTGSRGVSAEALAHTVVARAGGLAKLARAPALELVALPGIGPARAARLAAAFELGRRGLISSLPDNVLSTAYDVAARLQPRVAGLPHEVLIALAVDARNAVIAELEIARGSLTGVDVHPRELFRPLIRLGAVGCVIAHNHPSGDPEPSEADIDLTRRLQDIGQMIGIPILDHVIIGADAFVSLADRIGL